MTQDSDTVAFEIRFTLAKEKSLMGTWESRNGWMERQKDAMS